MKQLPNILTLGNLFCGTLAVVFVLETPAFFASYNGQDYLVSAPPPVFWASVLIGAAAVLDFLDGFAARLLKVSSSLGKELDSLADVVTFGLAPGLILFEMLKTAWMQQPGAMEVSLWSALPALLVPCFAALRLAKFNLDDRQKTDFLGIPTPAVGLAVASFPLVSLYGPLWLDSWLRHPWVLYVLIALLCLLMVSEIPFFSLKMKSVSLKGNALRYLWILIVLAGIPFLHWGAVPLALAAYIVLNVAKHWLFPD